MSNIYMVLAVYNRYSVYRKHEKSINDILPENIRSMSCVEHFACKYSLIAEINI